MAFGLWALTLLASSAAWGLTPGRSSRQMRQDAWTRRHGLPADVVHAITTTASGELWIGTHEGVVRFDGMGFSRPGLDVPPQAIDYEVRGVLEDGLGRVWVATEGGGAIAFGQGPARLVGGPGDASHHYARAFAETPDGAIWIGTAMGVTRVAGDEVTVFDKSSGMPAAGVRALAVDPVGRLLVGTVAGVIRREVNRWVPLETGGPRPAIRTLLVERDGTIWAGTVRDGLLRLGPAPGAVRVYGAADGLPGKAVTGVVRDHAGHLWVTMLDGGLAVLLGDRFVSADLPPGTCGDRLLAIAEDREGSLWLGSAGCGLLRLRDRPHQLLGVADGVPASAVTALAETMDGELWAGSARGELVRWDGRRFAPVPGAPDPATCEATRGLVAGPSGQMWILCAKGAVHVWRDGRTAPLSISIPGGTTVKRLFVTTDGSLWLDARALLRLRDGQITVHDGTSFDRYGFTTVTARGRVWHVRSGELVRLDEAGLRRFPYGAGTGAGVRLEASALHEDAQGNLWIALIGRGISRFREDPGAPLTVIGPEAGLPTARVFAIVEDHRGRLWMSSPGGIFSVARSELEAVTEGRARQIRVRFYGAAEGIPGVDRPQGHPTALRGRDGRLWFAHGGGLMVIDPEETEPALRAPAVVIHQVRLDGRTVRTEELAALRSVAGHLEIDYAARTLVDPEQVGYRYQLAGFDPSWIEVGRERRARYTNLPPGHYRFDVVASSGVGGWSAAATSLVFTVVPPFYRTWWFLAGGGGALVGLAFLLHHGRLRQARKRHEAVLAERERMAREIHDSLAQGFVATSVRMECAETALDAGALTTAKTQLQAARVAIGESLDEARRSVWALRPAALGERDLATALRDLAERLSGSVAVTFEVTGASRTIEAAVEENLFRIAQEAVSNAFRHARPTRVAIELTFGEHALSLFVGDDGVGLAPERERRVEGMGLANMRSRAAAMGGRLTIDSGAHGTIVEVSIPDRPV